MTLLKVGDKLTLHMDASGSGIGAVLSVIREGEERPMAYFSHLLTAAQCNYSASELECLAVVKAIDHFTLHLLGQRFTVFTDHSALVALLNSNRLNGRLMRWALALQAFDMDIKYRPGIHHQNADGLSRQCWPTMEASINTTTEEIQVSPKELEKSDNLSLGRLSPWGAGDVEGQPSTWPSQAQNIY